MEGITNEELHRMRLLAASALAYSVEMQSKTSELLKILTEIKGREDKFKLYLQNEGK